MRSGVVINLSFIRAKRQEGQFLNSRFFPSHWTDKFTELKIYKGVGEVGENWSVKEKIMFILLDRKNRYAQLNIFSSIEQVATCAISSSSYYIAIFWKP